MGMGILKFLPCVLTLVATLVTWPVGLSSPSAVKFYKAEGTQVRATPSTNTVWAENGLTAALGRRTWGCSWTGSST